MRTGSKAVDMGSPGTYRGPVLMGSRARGHGVDKNFMISKSNLRGIKKNWAMGTQ